MTEHEFHHPWCNFGSSSGKKPNECHQCIDFYERFPIVGNSAREMTETYFPQVKVIE